MAKPKSGQRSRTWTYSLLALVLIVATAGWYFRAPIRGLTTTGAAFAARTACACRYVAGRTLEDCKKDFEPGMAVVFLSDDEAGKAVTGWVPLLASDTARYRDGFGCVLDKWNA